MGKPTILCIDDEILVLNSLRDVLIQVFGSEYVVEIATSGEEALEVISDLVKDQVEIPLIISDQLMPGIKGDELLARIHAVYPKTLKVMLTGQATPEAIGNAINKANLFRYIAKPWNDTTLLQIVKEALQSYFQDKDLSEVNSLLEQLNLELEREVAQRTKELEYRILFEKLITSISTEFINLTPEEVNQSIASALQQLGEFTEVDCVFLCEFLAKEMPPRCIQQWNVSYYQTLQYGWINDCAFVGDRLRNSEVVYIPCRADLLPDAIASIPVPKRYAFQSLLYIPITLQKRLFGYIGLEMLDHPKEFSPEDIKSLQVVGEIFAGAIHRQQTEIALNQAQRMAHIGSWRLDIVTQKLIWSQEMFRIHGWTPTQVEPSYQEYFQLLHPQDRERVQDWVKNAIAQGTSHTIDYRIILPNGSIRYHEGRTEVERNAQGEICSLLGTAIDITDRKQAELAIQEREYRLRTLGDNLPKGLIYQLVHEPGRGFYFSYISAGIERLLGVSSETIIADDNTFWDLIIQEDLRFFQQKLQESMSNLTLLEMQIKKRTPTAQIQWFFTRSAPRRMEDGRTIWDGIELDITDIKQVESELQQAKEAAEAANLAKSHFLANMSHELRTPLNAILGFAQVLDRDMDLTIKQKDYLKIILVSGNHLLNLINSILEVSKVDTHKISLVETAFNLYELLQSLELLLRRRASEKELALSFRIAAATPQYIYGDHHKVRQVLINLIGNAIKFTQKGSIAVEIERLDRDQVRIHWGEKLLKSSEQSCFLEVAVIDTGIGIPPEMLETIFDAFTQVQSRSQSEGTGLGLTISRKFVHLMGGEIRVQSTLNQGSTFLFCLPLQPLATNFPEHHCKRRIIGLAPGQPIYRILIVNHYLEDRLLLVSLLSPLGFEIQEATLGEEVLPLCQDWHPHLILMATYLPGLTSYEVMQQIRQWESQAENSAKIPAIALTTYPLDEQSEQAFTAELAKLNTAGFNDYLSQPFSDTDLLNLLKDYLNVEYLYEDPFASSHLLNALEEEDAPLKVEDFSVMPRQWVTELHQSACLCFVDEVNELLEDIPPEHSHLQQVLTKYSYNFKFDAIMELTKEYLESQPEPDLEL